MSMRFAIVFFAVCVLIFLGGLGFVFFHFGPGKKLLEPPPPLMTRQEFQDAVFGKYAQQVVDMVGPPARRVKWGHDERWYYYRVTRDPVTNRVDNQAVVTLTRGTAATEIDFD